MKPIITILIAILTFGIFDASSAQAPKAVFDIHRGTNISHWLSQSNRRGEPRRAFFTAKDVTYLKSLGYDHLRIPIDEEQMWDESGAPEQEAFDLLSRALDWCAAADLKVIVDLHILRSHHFNAKEKPLWTDPKAQERFLQCWRDLSASMKNRPVDQVAYELMNEPVADDPESWNVLAEKAVAMMRTLEPDRFLVIGSNRWQSTATFDRLRVPANDPRIILSFHFYHPHVLTHYKAGWTKVGEYQGPVRYPGQIIDPKDLQGLPQDLINAIQGSNGVYNRDILEKELAKPLALQQKTGLPLYCGEWGCLGTVPEKDRLQWYTDVRAILEKHHIAWTHWDYKGSFGILRGREQEPYQPLIDVLLKPLTP